MLEFLFWENIKKVDLFIKWARICFDKMEVPILSVLTEYKKNRFFYKVDQNFGLEII